MDSDLIEKNKHIKVIEKITGYYWIEPSKFLILYFEDFDDSAEELRNALLILAVFFWNMNDNSIKQGEQITALYCLSHVFRQR